MSITLLKWSQNFTLVYIQFHFNHIVQHVSSHTKKDFDKSISELNCTWFLGIPYIFQRFHVCKNIHAVYMLIYG